MDKRYQVFVSSTYTDLIPERSEVMQALLELECMPAGMELFPAANDTQWNWIKKVINESDYYIVIVAGRYGTISKETELSYTEMEYRYALEIGKPVIGFLHDDISRLQSKFTEQSTAARKRLDSFRELVSSKLCKFYSSPPDLGAKVSRSLTQLRKQYPAVGWIRADVLSTLATSDEVLKFKEENEQLKERIYQLGLQKPESVAHLASGEELYEVEFIFTRHAISSETGRFKRVGGATGKVELSWNDMFSVIAPDLLANKRYWSLQEGLNGLIKARANRMLQKKYPKEKYYDFRISPRCADTILLQFRALKLITINSEGVWALTPYGDNYLTELLAVPKGKKKTSHNAFNPERD